MGKRLRVGAVHSNRLLHAEAGIKSNSVRKSNLSASDSWKKLPRKQKQKIAKKLNKSLSAQEQSSFSDALSEIGSGGGAGGTGGAADDGESDAAWFVKT
eukprot:g2977.t1